MNLVIIGASHAGISLAEHLKKNSFSGKITIIEKTKNIPVEKPPLSKKFLVSGFTEENIFLRKKEWFEANSVDLLLNKTVLEIDNKSKNVILKSNESIPYDYLVIATGAKPNLLPDKILQKENQYALRDFSDIKKITKLLESKKHITIIGAGYIGLELASSLKQNDFEVTILETSNRILERVASKELSYYFIKLHSENGVNISCNEKIEKVIKKEKFFQIKTNKRQFNTDLVLVGIGVKPEIDLAKDIGIDCERGILVDEKYETSSNNIFSIGDCALNKTEYGVVIESIHHAQFSASRASSYILGLQKPKYEEPWFWSDQFNIKLQSVGLYEQNASTIYRVGKREGSHSWWSFIGGHLKCVEAVNDVQAFSIAKIIFEKNISISPKEIENKDLNLRELIK